MDSTENLTQIVKQVAKVSFSWYDYTLFTVMLGISTIIGIYFGFFGKKQTTANEYLLGGKSMSVFPVAMSLVASQISGLTLLAVPADIYLFGITYWLSSFAVVVATIINAYVYFPVFHKLQITSTYEYLKLRFDKRIQVMSSFLFATSFMHYLPIVIYIPALAFAQATGVHIHLITVLVCGICIFYTTIGGLKAVVWTDTIQFGAMIVGIVAVIYVGVSSVGDIENVWYTSKIGERLDFDFDISPTKRDTFWAALIGLISAWISYVAINQGSVQKFMSLGSLKQAKRAMVVFGIGMVLIKSSSILIGLIIYTNYYDCDPFTSKQITAHDQLLPYFIMDVAGKIPGLPGLFIAGIFCAALSTLSACLNCLAGTIYEDFIKPFMSKNTTQKTVSNILKLIVVVVGIFSTAMVFVVEKLGGLLALSLSFSGITNGPLVGLFSLGMFVPWATSTGALYGGIASIAFNTWMIIGAQWYKAQGVIAYATKPTSIEGCDFYFNETASFAQNSTFAEADEPFILYRISYYYYTFIGIFIVFLVGLPISWFGKDENSKVDPDLISPVFHVFLPRDVKHGYYSIEKAMNVITENMSQNEEARNKVEIRNSAEPTMKGSRNIIER